MCETTNTTTLKILELMNKELNEKSSQVDDLIRVMQAHKNEVRLFNEINDEKLTFIGVRILRLKTSIHDLSVKIDNEILRTDSDSPKKKISKISRFVE